ncbi:MAG TPA: energy transducer TonB [Thermoanaerobaculia bacterium]|nr:energy transducer TonB [Thermoanaerobaculia bacterium]
MLQPRALAVALAVVFLAGAVQAQENPAPAPVPAGPAGLALKEARSLFEQQRYDEAVKLARKWLKKEPQGPAAAGFRTTLCHARTDGGIGVAGRPSRFLKPGKVDVSAPEIVYQQKPEYPEVARKVRLQGQVTVGAFIDQEGCVAEVKILQGLPMGLDQSSRDAVSRWVFHPAKAKGKPVPVEYVLTVNYRIE